MTTYVKGHIFYTNGIVKPVITSVPEDQDPEEYIDEMRQSWNELKDRYEIQGFVIGTVRSNNADN